MPADDECNALMKPLLAMNSVASAHTHMHMHMKRQQESADGPLRGVKILLAVEPLVGLDREAMARDVHALAL